MQSTSMNKHPWKKWYGLLLVHVPKGNGLVAHGRELFARVGPVLALLHPQLPATIDRGIPAQQDAGGYDAAADEAQLEAVPERVPRRVVLPVKVRCHGLLLFCLLSALRPIRFKL